MLTLQQLNDQVTAIYEEIDGVDGDEQRVRALRTWWKFLEETCTVDKPCIECRRDELLYMGGEG
jgi:hypothetical protein